MESIIPQASSFAKDIDQVILVITLLGGFWLLLAEGILFFFIMKFRKKSNPKASYIGGDRPEEAKWVHWPHYLVIVCDLIIIGFAVNVWYQVKQTLPPAEQTIRIVGQQWSWTFTHPGPDGILDSEDDIKSVDELHVQENVTYHFKLQSNDVIHSFSVPVFRLKQDAVPGRTITGWFKPTRRGTYDIQCAEMCGLGHGIMISKIFIESATEHAQWIEKNKPAFVSEGEPKQESPYQASSIK